MAHFDFLGIRLLESGMTDQEFGVARSPRSMRVVEFHESLHAQGETFQLKYLAQQADAVFNGIDDLIAATELAAPVRKKQPYVLVRKAAGSISWAERSRDGPSSLN